jgi:hypothetical protein
MKTFIVYGKTNKLVVQSTSKNSAKRRFSNQYPFDKVIYTQTKTR